VVSRRDVAEKAGVSFAVVSRVLNNSGYVAQEKRERVLRVAQELRYKPHPVAVSLKNNKTRQILYFVQDLSNNYYMAMYRGMVAFAQPRGYNFLLAGSVDFRSVNSLMVDGVILPTEHYTSQDYLQPIRVPVVSACYGKVVASGIYHVDADMVGAVKLAVDHLLSLGHRKIGYLSMDVALSTEPRPATFLKLTEGLWGQGAAPPVLGPTLPKGWNEGLNYCEFGVEAARQFLAGDRQATAFVSFNDDMAIGFMAHLQAEGVAVPQQVSVIGIDGHPAGQYAFPALTTISMYPEQHGWECAKMVIDLIEDREPEAVEPILGGLILRKSTAVPRG
jgi:DNA-binding LacI/PurR family transcriptional regulator